MDSHSHIAHAPRFSSPAFGSYFAPLRVIGDLAVTPSSYDKTETLQDNPTQFSPDGRAKQKGLAKTIVRLTKKAFHYRKNFNQITQSFNNIVWQYVRDFWMGFFAFLALLLVTYCITYGAQGLLDLLEIVPSRKVGIVLRGLNYSFATIDVGLLGIYLFRLTRTLFIRLNNLPEKCETVLYDQ